MREPGRENVHPTTYAHRTGPIFSTCISPFATGMAGTLILRIAPCTNYFWRSVESQAQSLPARLTPYLLDGKILKTQCVERIKARPALYYLHLISKMLSIVFG